MAIKRRHLVTQMRIEAPEVIEMRSLQEFAEECHTKIEPKFPLFLVFVDGQLVAFYYASPHVCIHPTVHPSRMSPRAFYEAARAIGAATVKTWGNPVWHIESSSKLNNPALLSKVGLMVRPLAVYEVM
jgi:hypothetical protein